MQLSFLNRFFTDEMIKAISWTLVHSLWQGLLAAGAAGLVILATKRSPARLRYNLLGVVLVLFIVTVSCTFISLSGATVANAQVDSAFATEELLTANSLEEAVVMEESWTRNLVARLNQHADKLVFLWLFFMLFNFIRLAAGLTFARQLSRNRVSPAPLKWALKLQALSARLGIRGHIRLLESELVKVPSAVGMFKPVILFPVGLLTQLPPEQVETVLLHELAHIRRRDYIMNVLQRFAESIFFFNPAILWISSRIRQEREACCDDIVMAHTSCRSTYLQALVSFQERTMPSSSYAMAITTRPQHLLNRVKRMLTQENKKLNTMEKTLLLAGLTAVMAFGIAPSGNEAARIERAEHGTGPAFVNEKNEPPNNDNIILAGLTPKKTDRPGHVAVFKKALLATPEKMKEVLQDTTKKKKPEVVIEEFSLNNILTNVNDDGTVKKENISVTDKQGKKYTINRTNGQVSEFMVDGKAIPASEMGAYTDLIKQIDAAVEKRRAEHKIKMDQHRVTLQEHKRQMVEHRKKQEEHRLTVKRHQQENLERRKVDMQRQQIERERTNLDRRYQETQKRQREEQQANRQRYEKSRRDLEKKRVELMQRYQNENKERELRQQKELNKLELQRKSETEKLDKLNRTTYQSNEEYKKHEVVSESFAKYDRHKADYQSIDFNPKLSLRSDVNFKETKFATPSNPTPFLFQSKPLKLATQKPKTVS